MQKRSLIAFTIMISGIFPAPRISAQTATSGQVLGTITDPTGAVVEGAKLALISQAGVRLETHTSSRGDYVFNLLQPGKYQLEITAPGFAPTRLDDVMVHITEPRSS